MTRQAVEVRAILVRQRKRMNLRDSASSPTQSNTSFNGVIISSNHKDLVGYGRRSNICEIKQSV